MDTQEFSPEVAKNMQAAFERVCRTLGMPDHYAAVIVEAKITHFANAGLHDADELSLAVLRDFWSNSPIGDPFRRRLRASCGFEFSRPSEQVSSRGP
jgi:hypothetical protein